MTTTNIVATVSGCLLLFVLYAATIFGRNSPNSLSRQYMAEPSIVVVGIFKNEAEGLAEWCKHYLEMQGVKHLYLIDNNSTDAWPAAIAPYKHNVTVISQPLAHAQVDHYNSLLAPLLKKKHAGDWVFVLGIDDFLTPSVPGSTIASVVRANSYFWTHRGTVVYFNTTNPHYADTTTYSASFLIAVTAAAFVLLCIANKERVVRQFAI